MNHRQLVAELRKLFADLERKQWEIGDLLCREVGPPGGDGAHNGSLDEIETLATELGVAVATLLDYRRVAATYAPTARAVGVTWSGHKAALGTREPAAVIDEAQRTASRHGAKVTVALVREIATKPKHQHPTTRLSVNVESDEAPAGWGIELVSAINAVTSNLRRIVTMLQAHPDSLSDSGHRTLSAGLTRADNQIGWIRAYLRGEDVADEAAKFLQEQN